MDFDLPVIGRQSGFNKYWGLLFLFILLLLIAECTDTVTVSSVPDLVIDSIRAVPDYTLPGGQIELTAVASDIAGRNLSYKWSTYPHAGSFADDTAQTTILTVAGILKAGMSLKVTLDVSNGRKSVTGYKWIAIDTGSTISGYIYYTFTHIPISGVIVTIANRADTSDSIGYYKLRDIRSDSYTLEAVKDGYDGYSSLVELRGNRIQNIFLTSPGNTAKLTGTVSTMEGNPLEKIQVTVLNDDDSKSELSDTTDIDGGYHLAGVPKGNRRLLIENGGNSPFDVLTDTMAVVITTDSMFCPLRGKMARVVFESNGIDSAKNWTFGRNGSSAVWTIDSIGNTLRFDFCAFNNVGFLTMKNPIFISGEAGAVFWMVDMTLSDASCEAAIYIDGSLSWGISIDAGTLDFSLRGPVDIPAEYIIGHEITVQFIFSPQGTRPCGFAALRRFALISYQ